MKKGKFNKAYILAATFFSIGMIILFSFIYAVNKNGDPFYPVYERREDIVKNYEPLQMKKVEAGKMVYSAGKVNNGTDNVYFVDMVEKSILGYKWVGGGGHINRDVRQSEDFVFSSQLLNENQNVSPTLLGVFKDMEISKITVRTIGKRSCEAVIYNGIEENEKFYYISFNDNVSNYTNFIFTLIYEDGKRKEYIVSDDEEISKLQEGKAFYFY